MLDVHTDPNVPPIPPRDAFEQMKDAEAIFNATRTGGHRQGGIKTMVQQFLPQQDD